MRHFIYQHLPAGGLRESPTRRPYVTGGLGAGVVVYQRVALTMKASSREHVTSLITRREERW